MIISTTIAAAVFGPLSNGATQALPHAALAASRRQLAASQSTRRVRRVARNEAVREARKRTEVARKRETLAKTPIVAQQVIVQQVVRLSFLDEANQPLNGFAVAYVFQGPQGNELASGEATSGFVQGTPGVIALNAPKGISTLTIRPKDEEKFEIDRVDDSVFLMDGISGTPVASAFSPNGNIPFEAMLQGLYASSLPKIPSGPVWTMTEEAEEWTFADLWAQKKPPKKKPAPKKAPSKQPAKPPARPPMPPKTQVRQINPAPIRVSSKVKSVFVKAPAGTTVYLEGKPVGTADSAGTVRMDLPKAQADAGLNVLLEKKEELTIFQAESKLLPYAPDTVDAAPEPKLELAALSVEVDRYPLGSSTQEGQLVTDNDLQKAYGRPKSKVKGSQPGTETWVYDAAGLTFDVRAIRGKDGKDLNVVESITITSPKGGSVAGLTVGDPVSKRDQVLKDGSFARGSESGASARSYLDGAVRVTDKEDKITSIRLGRDPSLLGVDLVTGAIADPLRVHVVMNVNMAGGKITTKGFDPSQSENLAYEYLKTAPGLQLVSSQDDADYVLRLQLNEMTSEEGKLLGLLPSSIKTRAAMAYSLHEILADDRVSDPILSSSSISQVSADYSSEVAGGAALLTILFVLVSSGQLSDTEKLALQLLTGVGAAAALENTRETLARARERLAPLAIRASLQKPLEEIGKMGGVSLPVVGVDPRNSTVSIAVGTNSLPKNSEFVLRNGQLPAFPEKVTGLNLEAVVARPKSVSNGVAVCELYRIKRSVDKSGREKFEEKVIEASKDGVSRILNPTFGMTYALPFSRI